MNPNTRTPKPDKPIGDYFPTRFLKPDDFLRWKVTEVKVTITRAVEEEVEPKPNQKEHKLVLYFKAKTDKEYPRGYLVSAKADITTLQEYGCKTVADLAGKQITIQLADWRGRAVTRIKSPTANGH